MTTKATKATSPKTFEAWEARLNAIVQRRVGCDLGDLEDYATYDAWEDGYSPSAYFNEVIAPDCGLD